MRSSLPRRLVPPALALALTLAGCSQSAESRGEASGKNQRQVALEQIARDTARTLAKDPAAPLHLVYPAALDATMPSATFAIVRRDGEVCVGAFDRGATTSSTAEHAFLTRARPQVGSGLTTTSSDHASLRPTVCGTPTRAAVATATDLQTHDLADRMAAYAVVAPSSSGAVSYPRRLTNPLAQLGFPASRTRRTFHASYTGHGSYFCVSVWSPLGRTATTRSTAWTFDSRWGLTTASPARTTRLEHADDVSGSCHA